MPTDVHQIDIEAVLASMPTPLVVLQTGTGELIYANLAAKKLPFAFGDPGDWHVTDEVGAVVGPETLPHSVAKTGRCFDGRLLHYTCGGERKSLRFHCHALDGGVAVLTCDDVTSLEDSQHELREALRSRDEIVSMAAHELRSPLGALQLVAERLRNRVTDLEGALRTELDKMASTAIRQTRRLSVLVSNLLDVTRIRTGKFELDREPASLADIVEESVEPLVEQAASAHKQLTLALEDSAHGLWDRVRMEQVVVNLVINAIKYGGSPIEVKLTRHASEIELCVADAGPGIAPAQQTRVFEPFERASSRHAAQSLGLGLFIVREIVAAHGGRIDLASEPGHTVFQIHLPLRDTP